MTRIGCAVLGATGAVGQRFIHLLQQHPWFQVAAVVASPAAAGQPYGARVKWFLPGTVPKSVEALALQNMDDLDPSVTPVVFSALPGGQAGAIERALAARGFRVFTNARDLRMEPDVPLLIPEINGHALNPEGPGFVVANGNCSGIILTLALAPLHAAFGIHSVDVTTMQALSGAGNPATVQLDSESNVLPHIDGEEDKLQTEPHKVLGTQFPIRATCTRVDVPDGHLESVHVVLNRPVSDAEVAEAFASFRGPEAMRNLPSAPHQPIHVLTEANRPQPKHDLMLENGMAVGVGRIRVGGPHLRFVLLGHNTVRGAAGQSILNAEWARERGLLE